MQTLFRGETLRGLLLNSYGWSRVGTYAGYAAVRLTVAAVIVLLAFMYEIAAWRKSYPTTVTNAPTGARVGRPHAA